MKIVVVSSISLSSLELRLGVKVLRQNVRTDGKNVRALAQTIGVLVKSARVRARKIFEFHLARWASNSQLLLVRGTYPLAQVFRLINNS